MVDAITPKCSDSTFETIEELYRPFADQEDPSGLPAAEFLLGLRSWLTNVAEFESTTGRSLIQDLMHLLSRIDETDNELNKDRLFRIVEHSGDSVKKVLKLLRKKIIREYKLRHISSVRVIDSATSQWLSKKPGRTIRARLGGKPYIKAFKRISSVDTIENRLLKAFAIRLGDVFYSRPTEFGHSLDSTSLNDPIFTEQDVEDAETMIHRWLRSDESSEIGMWINLPPNNTLLQHREYRKIWDAWGWLQELDDCICRDSGNVREDFLTALHWSIASSLNTSNNVRFIQQPCETEYWEEFSISLLNSEKLLGVFIPNFDDITQSLSIGNAVQERGTRKQKISSKKVEKIALEYSKDRIWSECGDRKFEATFNDDFLLIRLNKKTKSYPIEMSSIQEVVSQATAFLLNERKISRYSQPVEEVKRAADRKCVVDLFSVRPMYSFDLNNDSCLSFRLVQQYWKDEKSNIPIDCGNADAIKMDDRIDTISMRHLFFLNDINEKIDENLLSTSADVFSERLREAFGTESITCLIPDSISEFEIDYVRKSFNLHFKDASALPRGIAAIFDGQFEKVFSEIDFKSKDIVVVLETTNDGFSITPIVGIEDNQLKDKLPETLGIVWERHPSLEVKDSSLSASAKEQMQKHVPMGNEIVDLFGVDGLAVEAQKLSFVDMEDHWYEMSTEVDQIIASLHKHEVSNAHIAKAVRRIQQNKNSRIFLLPICSNFTQASGSKHEMLSPPISLVRGGQVLSQWQEQVGDIPLWKDHLPELAMEDRRNKTRFPLVTDTTIVPHKGEKVSIPISERFDLPKGVKEYRFKLYQGGKEELQYEARLNSESFPLSERTRCRLQMTYTYGADEPYELIFIPDDRRIQGEGFKPAKVKWCRLSDIDYSSIDLPCPGFPPIYSFEDFEAHPSARDMKDMIDWYEKNVEKLKGIADYGRCPGLVEQARGERYFSRDAILFSDQIAEGYKNDVLPFCDGDPVEFYKLETGYDKYKAFAISPRGATLDPQRWIISWLRFPTYLLWRDGFSISREEVTDEFRDTVNSGIEYALEIVITKEPEYTETLQNEMFFHLCCLQQDAPEEIAGSLSGIFDKEESESLLYFLEYFIHLGYALGDVSQEWQKKVLLHVINCAESQNRDVRSRALASLAISAWRCNDFVALLDEGQIRLLLVNLYECLQEDLELMKGKKSFIRESLTSGVEFKELLTFCNHLELLLALLRLRKFDNESIKALLYPNDPHIKQFIELIDQIIEASRSNRSVKLKSRIQLDLKKPTAFEGVPDLLYALQMYLSGDDGADAIEIIKVDDSV